MSADGADGDGGPKQRFELYIKASAIDKETKGSCPICQHWFMITCLLGENQDDIDFKVYTVQADCPPKNFGVEQGWSKKFPVVMVLAGHDKKGQDLTGTKYDTFEELETFFESINKECPELKRKNAPNVSAMQVVEDVYNAFNGFLSGKGPKRLISELKKINSFLEEEDCKFLVDNVMSFADCYLLPRLQHIRVAGKAYMDFDLPVELTAIWKYLAEAYKTEAFRSTMPSDQDIIFHYEKKVTGAMQRVKHNPRPTLQSFTYTMDIPADVAALIGPAAANTNSNGDVSQSVSDGLSQVDISAQPE
ncbi:chloride intracellular channel Clic-like [Babylonia areolata]|uniref:chloride intracellular channel Clic-like n=1 Tax=Babylonia areolata TaxID=304850 RepID=UPI003FCF9B39